MLTDFATNSNSLLEFFKSLSNELKFKDYISGLAFLISVFLVLRAVRASTLSNKRNKRFDAIASCNARYDTVYDLKLKIMNLSESFTSNEHKTSDANQSKTDEKKELIKKDARAYFARFWGLKSDEFDYWLAGFIDIETFVSWAFSTTQSFCQDKCLVDPINETKFRHGWETTGFPDNSVTNEWFTDFTGALCELGLAWDEQTDKDSKECRRKVHEEITDIVRIIQLKSKLYRQYLGNDMSLTEYIRTRRRYPKLNLLAKERGATLFKEKSHRSLNSIRSIDDLSIFFQIFKELSRYRISKFLRRSPPSS